ncbi:hypothetical protein [Flavobacterium salmonis]|uniref:Uncharacterized protein n=1 Tax=Flavobacterium salmonis TaxID=2654844 RepID=A0A6V6Z9S7_9FLAO|nr:hypothetical protein [Flavobacterium salmonis]CAD0008204.1 hypothetical protein FLAT13_04245 [Flavobacterium salmonis]
MSKQSEQILVEQFVGQLQKPDYKYTAIAAEKALPANLKIQLEKHNFFSCIIHALSMLYPCVSS